MRVRDQKGLLVRPMRSRPWALPCTAAKNCWPIASSTAANSPSRLHPSPAPAYRSVPGLRVIPAANRSPYPFHQPRRRPQQRPSKPSSAMPAASSILNAKPPSKSTSSSTASNDQLGFSPADASPSTSPNGSAISKTSINPNSLQPTLHNIFDNNRDHPLS